jgi:hypothetical protein
MVFGLSVSLFGRYVRATHLFNKIPPFGINVEGEWLHPGNGKETRNVSKRLQMER